MLGLTGGGAVAAASDFEHPASNNPSQQFTPGSVQRQDTPAGAPYHDQNYDNAEPDTLGAKTSTNLYDERYDLFGFPSFYTTGTAKYLDPLGPNLGLPQVSGYNAAGAWKLTRGDARVAIAILDTGIRWDNGSLRTQIHLNTRELPLPQDASGLTHPNAGLGGYDLNGDGVVNVDDYKDDKRVPRQTRNDNGTGKTVLPNITGQDLIKRFGHCQIKNKALVACPANGKFDNDGNGYPNDIAGWNYFDDSNDPQDRSSYFAAGNHGSGRAGDAAGAVGSGNIGTCPHCQIMPLRIWDTFVADANNFALATLYATDNGAKVVEGADGGLYHSAFMEQASNYAWAHNVVQTFSGDDLNTGNHNYPANYGHAMLIQGSVPDSDGLGKNCPSDPQPQSVCSIPANNGIPVGTHIDPTSYFRGANTTQYGGKSSISMNGSTGSINTGRASGAAGMVISAALQAGTTLRADEVREILEQTAEDVTQGNTGTIGTPDPAQPGWDSHFGWGRVDMGKAVSVAAHKNAQGRFDQIPDLAVINSPDWYAPLTGNSFNVTGHAEAPRTPTHQFHWKLEWGPGHSPLDSPGPGQAGWMKVAEGDSSGPVTNLGTINLNTVRATLAAYTPPPDQGGPVFSPTGRNPYKDQFTVRLTVTDPTSANRVHGVDRRVFTAVPNGQNLRTGFPKRLGTGGEAQPRYADLNADGVEELVLPTEDGLVHAYEPDGKELPGWPVKTQIQYTAASHTKAPGVASLLKSAPPREPPRGAAITDLDGDGIPEVVTVAGIHLYVWEPDGTLRKGFPVSNNRAFCDPSLERQDGVLSDNDPGSHPKCGFVASPAVARHLEGPNGPTDIVEPSLDGHLYAFRPNGKAVPHFPMQLADPHPPDGIKAIAESINAPVIVDLNGDGYDDVVQATNEAYGKANTSSDISFTNLASNATGQSTRVYAVSGKDGSILSGWPIKINGLIENVLPFVGPGNDPAALKVGGAERIVASATSGSLATYGPNGQLVQNMHQEQHGPGSNATDKSPGINLFEGPAIGKLGGSSTPAVVKYELTTTDAANLLLVSQNFPYNHLIGAWNSSDGTALPGFPTITDDFQFLSSSLIAKVNGGSSNQVVAGTGLGLLHAYDGSSGQDVSGFPKVTGGWLFAPAALSTDGRMADVTREGYLFEWSHSAIQSCQSDWPTFRHDPQDTGNYDRDGTAPAAPKGMTLKPLGHGKYRLTFTSPGDDGFCGKAASYRVKVNGKGHDIGLGSPANGGSVVSRDVTLPSGADLSLQAIDNAGNVGAPKDIFLLAPPGKPACRAPRTTIDPTTLLATRKRITLTGTAQEFDCKTGKRIAGHVKSMRLTVALVSKGKCRFMNGGGRLGHPGKCSKPHYLKVRVTKRNDKRGTVSWVFKHKVHLPTGRYVMAIRAGDAQGHRESVSRSANTLSFKLFR